MLYLKARAWQSGNSLAVRRSPMHRKTFVILIAPLVFPTSLLWAQTPCPTIPVVVNSPEDKLMLEYKGADKPQEQVAALEKFAEEKADWRSLLRRTEYLRVGYVA